MNTQHTDDIGAADGIPAAHQREHDAARDAARVAKQEAALNEAVLGAGAAGVETRGSSNEGPIVDRIRKAGL